MTVQNRNVSGNLTFKITWPCLNPSLFMAFWVVGLDFEMKSKYKLRPVTRIQGISARFLIPCVDRAATQKLIRFESKFNIFTQNRVQNCKVKIIIYQKKIFSQKMGRTPYWRMRTYKEQSEWSGITISFGSTGFIRCPFLACSLVCPCLRVIWPWNCPCYILLTLINGAWQVLPLSNLTQDLEFQHLKTYRFPFTEKHRLNRFNRCPKSLSSEIISVFQIKDFKFRMKISR